MARYFSGPRDIDSFKVISPAERSGRREQRYAFPIPVIILGFSAGVVFREFALTRNVSWHGCCVRVAVKPDKDVPLAVRIVPRGASRSNGHLLYDIVWVRTIEGGWEVGAVTPGSPGLLELAFPHGPTDRF